MIAPWRGAAPNPMAARAARAARAATEELGDFTTDKQQSPFLLSGFDQEIYFFFRVLRALGEHVELVTTRRRLHRVAAENRQLISAKGFRHPCIAQKTAVFSDLAEDFRQRERTVKLLQISHVLFQIGSCRRRIRTGTPPVRATGHDFRLGPRDELPRRTAGLLVGNFLHGRIVLPEACRANSPKNYSKPLRQ